MNEQNGVERNEMKWSGKEQNQGPLCKSIIQAEITPHKYPMIIYTTR